MTKQNKNLKYVGKLSQRFPRYLVFFLRHAIRMHIYGIIKDIYIYIFTIHEYDFDNINCGNLPTSFQVSCVIMQKNGAGLHTASSCYWDNTTDGKDNYLNKKKTNT